MTLRPTSLDCRSCNGSGATTGPAGIDACGACGARAEAHWREARRGQPLPAHLTPTSRRPRQKRAATDRSIA